MRIRPAMATVRQWASRRWTRRIVVGLGLAAVIFWVALNAFVAFGGLAHVVSNSTDDLKLLVDGGWAPWPGRIHADRVELRAHDDNIEFALVVEGAHVSVALHDLVSREFHATRVRGDAVRYYFRHKVADVAGDELRLAAFPKIPGFADPPLKKPKDDKKVRGGNPWTIRIEDVDIPVTELWMLEYRFQGKGRATGSFMLTPGTKLQVGPARLDLDSGSVKVGAQSAVETLSGRIDCHVAEHDPSEPKGLKALVPISGKIALEAKNVNLAVSGIYRQPGDAALSGRGDLSTDIPFEGGRVDEKAHAQFQSDGVTWSGDRVTVVASLEVSVDVAKQSERNDLRVRLDTNRGRATSGKEEAAAHFEDVHASVQSKGNDFTEPFALSRADLKIGSAKVGDVRFLNGLLKKHLFVSGRVSGSADLHAGPDNDGKGRVELRAADTGIRLGEKDIFLTGHAKASGISHNAQTHEGSADTVEAKLDEFRLKTGDESVRWWLSIVGHDVSWKSKPPLSFDATFDLGAEDAEPLLPVLVSSGIVRSAAKALMSFEKTTGTFSVARAGDVLELKIEKFTSGDLRVKGAMRDYPSGPCGAFLVDTGLANVGVRLTPSGTEISPFAGNEWLAEELGRNMRTRLGTKKNCTRVD